MEQTFVMIKPDGFKQKIFKDVMERLLKNGLSIKDVRNPSNQVKIRKEE